MGADPSLIASELPPSVAAGLGLTLCLILLRIIYKTVLPAIERLTRLLTDKDEGVVPRIARIEQIADPELVKARMARLEETASIAAQNRERIGLVEQRQEDWIDRNAEEHESIKERIDTGFGHVNKRLDDLKDFLEKKK